MYIVEIIIIEKERQITGISARNDQKQFVNCRIQCIFYFDQLWNLLIINLMGKQIFIAELLNLKW